MAIRGEKASFFSLSSPSFDRRDGRPSKKYVYDSDFNPVSREDYPSLRSGYRLLFPSVVPAVSSSFVRQIEFSGLSIREEEEEEEDQVNENYRARVIFRPGKRGRKFSRKKSESTLARLYSKLISSPPFVLTLLTFHLFDFVEALQPPDMLPSFFGSSAFARPALHFQVAISLYRSLSLSLSAFFAHVYIR